MLLHCHLMTQYLHVKVREVLQSSSDAAARN